MLSIEEINDEVKFLKLDLKNTRTQLAELPPGDPDDLRQHLEDDIDRLTDEIESCEADIFQLIDSPGDFDQDEDQDEDE